MRHTLPALVIHCGQRSTARSSRTALADANEAGLDRIQSLRFTADREASVKTRTMQSRITHSRTVKDHLR
jgi:hypothetical protein